MTGWFMISSTQGFRAHTLPIFWLHYPLKLRLSVQMERAEKEYLLLNYIGLEVRYSTSDTLSARTVPIASPKAKTTWKQALAGRFLATPLCCWGEEHDFW